MAGIGCFERSAPVLMPTTGIQTYPQKAPQIGGKLRIQDVIDCIVEHIKCSEEQSMIYATDRMHRYDCLHRVEELFRASAALRFSSPTAAGWASLV